MSMTSHQRRQAVERAIVAVVALGKRIEAAAQASDATAVAELCSQLEEARLVLERSAR